MPITIVSLELSILCLIALINSLEVFFQIRFQAQLTSCAIINHPEGCDWCDLCHSWHHHQHCGQVNMEPNQEPNQPVTPSLKFAHAVSWTTAGC